MKNEDFLSICRQTTWERGGQTVTGHSVYSMHCARVCFRHSINFIPGDLVSLLISEFSMLCFHREGKHTQSLRTYIICLSVHNNYECQNLKDSKPVSTTNSI